MQFVTVALFLGTMSLPCQSTVMKFLSARSLAAAELPDPMCKTGVISLKKLDRPQSCCASYCGECTDYGTCESVRGQDSKFACCASAVYERRCGKAPANVCLKKCSESVPPCIMDKDEIVVKDLDRNAADNCSKAVPDWRARAESAMKQGTFDAPKKPSDAPEAADFVKLETGQCPSARQVGKEECLAAAKTVGADEDKTSLDGGNDAGNSGRPHGCTIHKWRGNVEWWGPSDDADCGNKNYHCVCRSVAALQASMSADNMAGAY